jgi:hypothetical protein
VRVERQLAATPEAAAEARHALGDMADMLPGGRARDVRLLVIDLADSMLRVEVHDPGGGFIPSAPSPDPARPSGWGLYLVAELADRWGVDSDERTLVWFELDRAAA